MVASQRSRDAGVQHSSISGTQRTQLIAAVQSGSLELVLESAIALPLGQKHLQGVLDKMTKAQMQSIKPRKRGTPSLLVTKDPSSSSYEALQSITWESIVNEFQDRFPHIYNTMTAMMLPMEKRENKDAIKAIMPRLGMIYSILAQTRVPYLSRVQRLISCILTDSLYCVM